MGVNIQGLLNHYKNKSLDGLLQDDKGVNLNHQQAVIALHNFQVDGFKLIPNHNCEGFDPFDKGCPGHEIKD